MTTGTVHEAEPTPRAEVDRLLRELHRRGIDLGRRLCLAYMIEAGRERDVAYVLRQVARDDGWDSSVYGDASGWVVRLVRRERVTGDVLLGEHRYVGLLADAFGSTFRGVSVEECDPGDEWTRLAARQPHDTGTEHASPTPVAGERRPAASGRSALTSIA